MSKAWQDFKRHGGKTSSRTVGKILCTCIGCGEQEFLFASRVYDQASRAKCKACGWGLEPSKSARATTVKAHSIRPMDEMKR